MIDPRHPNYAFTPASSDRPRFVYGLDDLDQVERLRPAVTIITPFYNVGPVFHETARSVLGQSLQNFEWIIVNDASTSRASVAMLDEYRGRDPRIRVLDHKHNHGLPAARNTGFRAARSEYVFQIDGDDLIEPTTVEKCLLTLECNPEFAFAHGLSVGFEGQEYLWDRGFHNGSEFLTSNLVTATAMIRTRVHRELGGFDETIRGGLEDWEFWLRAAEHGHWGATIEEYLDWYRRRPRQHDNWANLRNKDAQELFRSGMRRRFPRIFQGDFPNPIRAWHLPYADVPSTLDVRNPLAKQRPRALVLLPWLRMGGADKFNLDVLRQLTGRGWEVTLAATLNGHPWLPDFARLTPDIFLLGNYAGLRHYPRLIRYLIESRRPDVVLITNSEMGYLLLPFLRAHCPGPAYLDYNHMEEEYWKNGGHPRSSVGWRSMLDLTITSSQHLKRWMVSRGSDPARIEVCTTNCDPSHWKPDEKLRARVRRELKLEPGVPVLLYAVRLTDQKQPMVFAESIRRLRERCENFVALVAGDGEDRGKVEAFVQKHGLGEHVRMLGSVPIHKMPGLFAASDIFFLPSKWEGIALSVFEAMSAGLAVVGANVGGQIELVTPETGVLIERGQPDSEARQYADILAELLADPARRARMGQAARRRITTHYQLGSMGDRMIELLELAREHRLHAPREVITKDLAHELAVQAVESVRLHELAEHLWQYREQVLGSGQNLGGDHDAARREMEAIEQAGSWRALQRVKRLTAYKLLARMRWGEGWDQPAPEDPPAKLARIRASRSYRLIRAVKRLPPVVVYSRLRHGTRTGGRGPI